MVYAISKNTIGAIARLYIEKIKGIENIPKEGAYIVAANHASYLDHLILQTFWAKKLNKVMHFLAKKEHFRGLQKLWHVHFGAIPIDRQAGGEEALKKAIDYLKKKRIIAIYPEGTRTLTGKLQKAKTGVARLVLITKVPVLPVGLMGTFEILPKGKRFPKFKRKIRMNIGKPMYFDKYYGKINKKNLRLVTNTIMKEIAKLSNQQYRY